MAKHRNRLYELMEDGALDATTLARDLLGYMSDDDCKDFAQRNDIELFPEEEEEEQQEQEFEFSEENEVRKAFSDAWDERCNHVPAYRTDKPAKRMAFTCFVDDLQREGRISDELANEVTLGDED